MLPNGRASFTSELALLEDLAGRECSARIHGLGKKFTGLRGACNSGVASCAATHRVARARTTDNGLPLRRRYVKRSFVGPR
jgi:hypothetical protein